MSRPRPGLLTNTPREGRSWPRRPGDVTLASVTTVRAACDWAFRDRASGRWVVGQRPNLPLGSALLLEGVRRVGGFSGVPGACLGVAGTAAFAWWAVEEVASGVNPWRRALGVAGLAGAVWRARSAIAHRA